MNEQVSSGNIKIPLSGWATKEFSLEELKNYLYQHKPELFEISKDFVDSSISIKKTYELLNTYKKSNKLKISYAGTTDFVNCSGLPFPEYLKYLSIQASQAKFLGSDFFRIMIGGEEASKVDLLPRLAAFSKLIKPTKLVIEIHGGWESSFKNLKKLIENTKYEFVIDFQNLLESNLSFEKLNNLLPRKRVAYYHSRNLLPNYIEHEKSLQEEKAWITGSEKNKIIWEPKLIKKERILELSKLK